MPIEDLPHQSTAIFGWDPMILSAAVLIVSYIILFTEKLNRAVVALLGASVMIFSGILSQETAIAGIDFNTLALLIGMMTIVGISEKSGMFQFVAVWAAKKVHANPRGLLVVLSLVTAVFSALLDNVTTVLLIVPVTFQITRKLKINPYPYLIAEIFASNIGGTATLIGDPPNILIGSAINLSFMDFVNELTGIIAIIFLCITSLMLFIYRKQMVTQPEKMTEIANLDNSSTITDKNLMIRSLIVLFLVILGFVTHDITHIQTCVCAMAGGSILLLFEKPTKILESVEWNTIFFFIGLFIIIGALEASGGIALMAKWLLNITHGSESALAMVILWGSGILSGIIDNIPYTATMAPMISSIQSQMGADYAFPLWWSLALGACLGGNMTIIGAAANVIVTEAAAAKGYKIEFLKYLKYGILVTFISLLLSSIYVYLRFLL